VQKGIKHCKIIWSTQVKVPLMKHIRVFKLKRAPHENHAMNSCVDQKRMRNIC